LPKEDDSKSAENKENVQENKSELVVKVKDLEA